MYGSFEYIFIIIEILALYQFSNFLLYSLSLILAIIFKAFLDCNFLEIKCIRTSHYENMHMQYTKNLKFSVEKKKEKKKKIFVSYIFLFKN